MVKKGEIYRCSICGNVVEVIDAGGGTLVCCNQNMELQYDTANEEEQLKEKHIPIIEVTNDRTIVKVGEIEHPMVPEHCINWIEVNIDGSIFVKKLNPGEKPIAEFKVTGYKVSARCLCNIHGTWKSQ